jgi:hypothetical protein
MKDFESIVIEIYNKNKVLGFIDEPSSIKNSTNKLIGKYWKWDKSLPENIIFGINGSILFTNDSIYVNELTNRYKFSDFNSYGNRFSVQKILFSRRLYFTNKKDTTIEISNSISLTENEFNLLNSIIQSFISYQNKIKKELLDIKIRKEEEERKKYEEENEKYKEEKRRKENEEKRRKEIERVKLLEITKKEFIISYLKDGELEIPNYLDFENIVKKNQDKIIEIDRNYIQKFIKISVYLKSKKQNIFNLFTGIRNYNSRNDIFNLKQQNIDLLNEIKLFETLIFHSVNMVTSLINNDMFSFYEIYESLDKLGIFNSNWEKEIHENILGINYQLSSVNENLRNLNNNIINTLNQLSYIQQKSNQRLVDSVNHQLNEIGSNTRFNNHMIEKQIKNLDEINRKLG